ncbi:MAG: PASTA domain-containing protein [Desulforhopalus sp.]|nr:PASTA domain-containing protein [Desulforhopalus sp.]
MSSVKEVVGSITGSGPKARVPRGTFYDRNLKQLAVTLDRVSVFARIQELKSVPDTVKVLAEILSLDEKELQQKLETTALRVWLAEDISMEQEIAIKSKRLAGVYLQKEEKRFYPNGSQAAHLIGYAEDGIGLAGVEHYFDRLLANRKYLKKEQPSLNSSEDLVLTLDLKIQDILDKMLEDIAKQEKVRWALAYLMDGQTGEIVGGAQIPGFDLNNFAKYSKEVLANRFVSPILLPDNFRRLLRDLSLLHVSNIQESPAKIPWSLRSADSNLGSQLQLWEWLGLNEKPVADFHLSKQPGEQGENNQQPLLPRMPHLEMVPDYASPFAILTTLAALHNDGKAVRPFVVQKDGGGAEDGTKEASSPPKPEGSESPGEKDAFALYDGAELFRSQGRPGISNSYFFRDEILVKNRNDTRRQMSMNELLLVAIPSGGNDLHLLVVVEREQEGPNPKNGKKTMNLEQIVEEKIERISILQQVAKTVADVVEPESSDEDNYQREKDLSQGAKKVAAAKAQNHPKLEIMPDFIGQSLRKSLITLQGVYLKINIRGTGKVVAQKPAPGTSLKGVSECTLILNKGEDMVPEKFSKTVQ